MEQPKPPAPQILKYFAYAHLPPQLQEISKPICELAHTMAEAMPPSAEQTVGLRKLLEAKDAFVRAKLDCGYVAPEKLG